MESLFSNINYCHIRKLSHKHLSRLRMLFWHLSGGKTGCTGRFSGGVPHWDFLQGTPPAHTLALTALTSLAFNAIDTTCLIHASLFSPVERQPIFLSRQLFFHLYPFPWKSEENSELFSHPIWFWALYYILKWQVFSLNLSQMLGLSVPTTFCYLLILWE